MDVFHSRIGSNKEREFNAENERDIAGPDKK